MKTIMKEVDDVKYYDGYPGVYKYGDRPEVEPVKDGYNDY